ncbi:MAG: hypothetical protein WB779_05645 [Ignavibacteriaceae bacterium]|jgi:hypothetical protein
MIGETILHYKILENLSEGGMHIDYKHRIGYSIDLLPKLLYY